MSDEKSYSYEIVSHIGVLSESKRGWKKELTRVSWDGREPVFDLRDWSADYSRMSKGTTLTTEELRELYRILYAFFGSGGQS